MNRKGCVRKIVSLAAALCLSLTASLTFTSAASTEHTAADETAGGGYAVSGQLENIGHAYRLYDASNGLPTSDANTILATSDGYIWIGGYSGLIRYDGSTFERQDSSGGITNAKVLLVKYTARNSQIVCKV